MSRHIRIFFLLLAMLALAKIVRDYYYPQFQYSGEGPPGASPRTRE